VVLETTVVMMPVKACLLKKEKVFCDLLEEKGQVEIQVQLAEGGLFFSNDRHVMVGLEKRKHELAKEALLKAAAARGGYFSVDNTSIVNPWFHWCHCERRQKQPQHRLR